LNHFYPKKDGGLNMLHPFLLLFFSFFFVISNGVVAVNIYPVVDYSYSKKTGSADYEQMAIFLDSALSIEARLTFNISIIEDQCISGVQLFLTETLAETVNFDGQQLICQNPDESGLVFTFYSNEMEAYGHQVVNFKSVDNGGGNQLIFFPTVSRSNTKRAQDDFSSIVSSFLFSFQL